MADKNKLPKDVEEQIQGLASDVYIQIEDKLTHLIATAVKAEVGGATDQQTKASSEKEQSLAKELEQLKKTLAEKNADQDAVKQGFQVELTQKTINYTETIERLEKELVNAKSQSTKDQSDKQSTAIKLEEKLLEVEQKLTNKTQETDGLNGRIMVLTEQEQSLTKQLADANGKIQAIDKQQSEAVKAAKAEGEASAKTTVTELTEKLKLADEDKGRIQAEAQKSASNQVAELTEKLKKADEDKARIQAETQQTANTKVAELEKKLTELQEQVTQEQNGKVEIQQQLSAMQKSIDTEQDKTKAAEQRCNDYQEKMIKLTEQAEEVKQKHLDEIQAINDADQDAKNLQKAAQQKIIELEKDIELLNGQVETEKKDVTLYQQEVTVLNEQLKVAQESHENLLERFNGNREKQEIENNKVRETIKFLRDENHQLITDSTEQKTQFTDQINELEHKITEYRLKFEYAQKQLTN